MKTLKLSFIPNKIAIWFSVYLTGVLFFALFRLFFLSTHIDLLGNSSLTEILYAFWIGFRFDSLILSAIILPLLLISLLPFVRFRQRLTRNIFLVLLTTLLSLSFLISTADLCFYDNFGSRMNYWAIEYLEYPGLFLYTSASQNNVWILVLLWIVATVLYCYIIRKIFIRFSESNLTVKIFPKTIVYILAVLLLAFGIRGRVGIQPLNWGTAFFSENHFIDQLALNSVYTLSRSIYEEIKNGRNFLGEGGDRFAFYDKTDAYRSLRRMLGINNHDSSGTFNMERTINSDSTLPFKPNLIFVIMESWSADKVGALGSDLNITPEFDKLSADGMLFTDFYSNGVRTNRGIPAILCSFPSLPGRSIMKRYAADYPFRSVAQILKPNDYTSVFAYGGDIEFDNMRGFLKSVGYDRFYAEEDFGTENILGKWGMPDHIVFNQLADKIKNLPRPFNLTVLTLSSHDPYLIPDDRFELYDDSIPDSHVYNCFYYSDWAIGRFIDSIKQQPVFDSTIFIFTADHCVHQSSRFLMDPKRFHVPLLIYAPMIFKDKTGLYDKTGSQVDIFPTLLGLIGLETTYIGWGRDMMALENNDPGFAVIVLDEKLGFIEDNMFYLHWASGSGGAGSGAGSVKILFNIKNQPYLKNNLIDSLPDTAARMDTLLNSYIQMANYLSRGGRLGN